MSSESFVSLVSRLYGSDNSKAVREAQAAFTDKLYAAIKEGGLALERDLHDWFGDARFNELLDGAAPSLDEASVFAQILSRHRVTMEVTREDDLEPIRPTASDNTGVRPGLMARLSPGLIAAGVSGALALGALGVAYTSIQSAEQARANSVEAEAFSARLVTTLAEELPHDASSPVFETVASEALSYFQSHDTSASPETLRDWSRLFTIVGRTRWNAGDTRGAREAFETAMAATERRLAQDRESLNARFDHSQTVFWLADFNYRNGDFDAAEAGYDSYAGLTAELYNADPDRPLYQAEYAYGFLNTAIMDLERGRPEAALEGFTTALNGLSDVGEISDLVSAQDIANAQGWRARALFIAGQFEQAAAERENVLSTYRSLPPTPFNEYRTLTAIAKRAEALLALGDVTAAWPLIEEGSDRASALLVDQPDNVETLRQYLTFMLQRVELNLAEDRPLAAKLVVDHARSSLAHYLEGTDRIVPARETANFSLAAAEVALQSGAYDVALFEAQAAIRVFEQDGSFDGLGQTLNAFAHQLAGQAYEATGRPDLARRSYLQGLDILARGNGSIQSRVVRARLEYLAGNTAEALALRQDISTTGFMHPRDVAFWRRIDQSGVVQNNAEGTINGG